VTKPSLKALTAETQTLDTDFAEIRDEKGHSKWRFAFVNSRSQQIDGPRDHFEQARDCGVE
jgi:hypothetical protein